VESGPRAAAVRNRKQFSGDGDGLDAAEEVAAERDEPPRCGVDEHTLDATVMAGAEDGGTARVAELGQDAGVRSHRRVSSVPVRDRDRRLNARTAASRTAHTAVAQPMTSTSRAAALVRSTLRMVLVTGNVVPPEGFWAWGSVCVT
jgi:hypothetical protein